MRFGTSIHAPIPGEGRVVVTALPKAALLDLIEKHPDQIEAILNLVGERLTLAPSSIDPGADLAAFRAVLEDILLRSKRTRHGFWWPRLPRRQRSKPVIA